jgi:3-oxoacyl-[acyl-carrier-protein] synthase II
MTSLYYGLEGPSVAITLSCASGAQSICQAYDWIKLGRVQMAIAGGAEAALCCATLSSFNKLQALSERNSAPERASRPFDRERDGFVLGDGAGVLILESAEHCRKRGGRPYARMCGYGATAEAHHMVHPAENGTKMARTMERALRDASMAREAVDYVNAHGTSTRINDQCETAAIKQVFGGHARELSIGSTKSMVGHTIGAAGAIELAITALSVANDVVTPTINYEYPDEECDLDYTPNVARQRPVRVAISNSFGFGGHNCSIVLAKP